MPPKKLRSTSKRSREQKSFSSIGIQTEDNYNVIEEYKRRIEILEKENDLRGEQINKLQSELLKQQNNNKIKTTDKNGVVKVDLVGRNSSRKKNKIASPEQGTKISKGCSCKGNCSNKVCGCVKKELNCNEFCRCNDDQCKNQEPDKENVNVQQEELCQDGQKALEKLGRLTLNQEHLHASEKKSKRGLFSPFIGRNNEIAGDVNYPASPLTFETRRRLFTQDSDDIVDIETHTDRENSLTSESEFLMSNNLENLVKSKVQLSYTPVATRTRKPKFSDKSSKTESCSNGTQSASENIVTSKEVTEDAPEEKKIQSENNTEVIVLRKVPDIIVTGRNEENKQKEDIPFQTKSKRVVHSPQYSRQNLQHQSHVQEVEEKIYDNRESHEDSKSNALDEFVTHRNNDKPVHKSNLGNVQHSPKPIRCNSTNLIDENSINNRNEDNRSFESNTSEGTTDINPTALDVSLNPMMPKRQLQRSPINASGKLITPVKDKRFSPPKKELAVVEVNWELHQSELIKCNKCKRKFFPHRIEKHAISCKGI